MTQSPASSEALLTISQVAERTNMSTWAVRDRIAEWIDGDPAGLPAINVGGTEPRGRRWRVDPETLNAWLREVR